jgi:hypothetical protein
VLGCEYRAHNLPRKNVNTPLEPCVYIIVGIKLQVFFLNSKWKFKGIIKGWILSRCWSFSHISYKSFSIFLS